MKAALELKVKVAWWVKPYIFGVLTFAALTGAQPDDDKVLRTVMRGIKIRPR